ncbi:hypothetical protein AMR41_27940 [Hapalosiphon sp. MRB220]|nr:hypothetical protein AMR41_27940 [Hapalosiphon sp. MRB220]
MTDVKIQGKFYPLQNSEWVKCCKELTKSQLSVLYYLRSLDPYGNGIKFKASAVAEILGITKRAVNSAIAFLEEKGYILLDDIEYSAKISAGGCLCDTSSTVTEVGTEFPTREQNFPVGNRISQLGTEFPSWEQNFPPENRISHLEPETLTQQVFQNSKINKDYLDFLDSLSEGERESFLKFGEEKAAKLPSPPQLPRKWIEANFEELAAQWRKTPSGAATNSKWENDPRHQEWMDKIRSLGFGTFIYESGKRDKEREEFFRWANANNLIWGAES